LLQIAFSQLQSFIQFGLEVLAKSGYLRFLLQIVVFKLQLAIQFSFEAGLFTEISGFCGISLSLTKTYSFKKILGV